MKSRLKLELLLAEAEYTALKKLLGAIPYSDKTDKFGLSLKQASIIGKIWEGLPDPNENEKVQHEPNN